MTSPPKRDRPLVVAIDETARRSVASDLADDGWSVRSGFDLDGAGWQVSAEATVCEGEIRDQIDAAAAVLAAVRGAGLILTVKATGDVRARLYEDLGRLGELTIADGKSARPPLLGSDQRQLLDLLATGQSLYAAARALGYSRRTIERRLADAQSRLGAQTVAEALTIYTASK